MAGSLRRDVHPDACLTSHTQIPCMLLRRFGARPPAISLVILWAIAMISVMLAVQTVAVSKANREWLVVALVMTPTVDDICSQDVPGARRHPAEKV